MITQLDLHFFKCFEILRLPIAPLTLLSGSNASGKSSVLQAFVLLHQTIREHEWSRRLMLNGKSIRLGTVSDVIDKVNGRRTFEVGIKDGDNDYLWTFKGDRSEMSMAVDRVIVNGEQNGALWYFAGLAFYFNFKKLSYFMRLVLNNFLTLLLGHMGLYCTKISISA